MVETTTILAEEATTRARTVVKTTETTGIMIGGIAEASTAGETMIEVAGTEEVLDTMTSAMMDRLVVSYFSMFYFLLDEYCCCCFKGR